MKERPNNTRIHDWLDETVGPAPDPVEGTRQVMSQVEETSQTGRWLPFSLFRRKARASGSTPSSTDTAEYQPRPVPATNGHTPTAIGRTTSMLSPVKAITAGALVLAIGGAFLFAQPFQQATNVPGAEAPPVEPTWVTGTAFWAPSCSGPESVEVDGDVTRELGYVCGPTRYEASDPRLTTEGTWRWNTDVYDTAEGRRAVVNGAEYLRNDGGGWTCPITRLASSTGINPTQYGSSEIWLCAGDGGYEGLSALIVTDENSYSNGFNALIFSGDIPPLPEPPTAE